MFYTVQELLAQIKGWEYMIAILFLGIFIGFWVVLNRQPVSRTQLQTATPVSKNAGRRYRTWGLDSSTASSGNKPEPCWEARSCPPEKRESCAGFVMNPLPCWVARPMVSGERWEPCAGCSIYKQGIERLVEAYSRSRSTPRATDFPPFA